MTDSTQQGRFRGAALIRAIEKRIDELKMNAGDVAQILEYDATYFRTILRGGRWIGSLGHEKLQQLAVFLDVPTITVYVLADILKPQDFTRLSELKERLDAVYEQMKAHKTVSTFVPSREIWNRTPQESQILALVLYQRLAEKDFLTGLIPMAETSQVEPAAVEAPPKLPRAPK